MLKSRVHGRVCNAAALGLCTTIAAGGVPGRVVVVSDEFPFYTARAVTAPNDGTLFAQNVAAWFTGGVPGRFLAYSNAGAMTSSQIRDAMESAGHEWNVSLSADTSLANLLTFDGVFLAGPTTPPATLHAYVQAGGNVYIAGGTGSGGADGEAARYNPFLANYGLRLVGPYNNGQLDVPVSSTSPLLAGVDHLYAWGAHGLTDLTPSDPSSELILDHAILKIGIYDAACALPGDTNCDCSVNLTDLSTLLANFGTPSGADRGDGDLNGDGDVDLSDLAVLLGNFGSSC